MIEIEHLTQSKPMRCPIPFLWIKEIYCGSFYLERNEREKVKGLELLQP